MQQLIINNDVFHIPSSWNELSPGQLLKISGLTGAGMPLNKFFTHLMLCITGLRPVKKPEVRKNGAISFWFRNNNALYLISSSDIAFICSKLGFLFTAKKENGKDVYYLNSMLTKNLLPVIKSGEKSFYGPADALTNLSFSEYIHAETNLDHYNRTSSQKYINMLIAVLYRPHSGISKTNPNYKGDVREPFNDFLIETRAAEIFSLADDIKQAILIYYSGCRQFIAKKFENVFSAGSGKAQSDMFMEFMKLVNALSDSDITKKEQVRQAYLYDVLITLEELAIQQNKLKTKTHGI